jgi:hypothetical protein
MIASISFSGNGILIQFCLGRPLFRHEVKREDHATQAQALHKQVAFWLRVHASILLPSVWSRRCLFATSAIPHNNVKLIRARMRVRIQPRWHSPWNSSTYVKDEIGPIGIVPQETSSLFDYDLFQSSSPRNLQELSIVLLQGSQQLLARYEADNPPYLDATLLIPPQPSTSTMCMQSSPFTLIQSLYPTDVPFSANNTSTQLGAYTLSSLLLQ